MSGKASRKVDAGGGVKKRGVSSTTALLRTKGGSRKAASLTITDATTAAKKKALQQAHAEVSVTTKIPKTKKTPAALHTSPVSPDAIVPAAPEQRTAKKPKVSAIRTAENIATNDPGTRKLKFPKIAVPAITHKRMRAVAYTGVTYVLLGVMGASYALAGINGFVGNMQMRDQVASVLTTTTDSTTTTTSNSGSGSSSGGSGEEDSLIDTTASTDASGGTNQDGGDESTSTAANTTTSTVNTDATDADADSTLVTTSSNTNSVLKMPVDIRFSVSQPFKERVSLLVMVERAERVELVLQPLQALTPLYLGRANNLSTSPDEWRYVWDTRNVPNGRYELTARVRNMYGWYESPRFPVEVFNPIATSSSGTSHTPVTSSTTDAAITTIEDQMKSALESDEDTEVATSSSGVVTTQAIPAELEDDDPVQNITQDKEIATSTSDEAVRAQEEAAKVDEQLRLQVEKFKRSLLELIERFAIAYRAQEDSALMYARQDIGELKESTLRTIREKALVRDQNYDRVAQELQALIDQEIARIETREKMILERVGDIVLADTDQDGVVDYDEVHLYKTDPTVADSDGDGFTDGAEVMGGFDPIDPQGESPIAFENPEDTGPVREDMLAVESIETATVESRPIGAKLTGRGFPNSFVRLYIFSTPVVVTVRTEADGSWTYIFDKELEDGEHTVYVGVTDNAGRIVAKSNPFPFVKTAEAFTGITDTKSSPVEPVAFDAGFLSPNAILLIVATTLIMCGLALIALGSYFMRPREIELHEPQVAAT